MPDPVSTTAASDDKAEELEKALEKAAEQPRDSDHHDIAADDAGGSTVGETP